MSLLRVHAVSFIAVEGLLERVLAEYFGEWVVGLDRDKLRVGVFSGEIVLRNLRLRKVDVRRLQF
jgi:hypothetical protein